MLDRLPPFARHAVVLLVLAPLVALLGVFTLAVLTADGVFSVDWAATARAALDAAGVSEATGIATLCTLFATPLTSAYGMSAPKASEVDEGDDA